MPRLLSEPEAIRQWAEARAGSPMLLDNPGGHTILTITFGQHALDADANEGPDRPGGYRLASWQEWLEALRAEGLALEVRDEVPGQLDNEFAFISLEAGRPETGAAKKPAAIVTDGAARRR
jgi:hypothetical protein